MGFDENIFRYLALKWTELRSNSSPDKEGLVRLELIRNRLEKVGGALLGIPLRVDVSDAEERSFRDLLVLPARIGIFDKYHQNENLFWYRLLIHFGAEKLQLYSHLKMGAALENRVSEALLELPKIVEFLAKDLPRFDQLHMEIDRQFEVTPEKFQRLWRCFRAERLPGNGVTTELLKLLPELPLNQLRFAAREAPQLGVSHPALTTKGSEVKVKTSSHPRVITSFREKDNPLVHVFEKVLTADNFQGGAKTLDGSDESAEHAEALSELTLDSIIRTGKDTESFVKSNAVIETSIQVEAVGQIPVTCLYPEWFHREGVYRRNWCALNEFVHPVSPLSIPRSALAQIQVESLRQRVADLLNEYVWRNRQKDGAEIDIDALVNWWAQKNASGYQDQRIFCARKRMERDIAFLVLVDGSLSTDSWVANRRVLDEIYQATDILSQVLEDFSEKIAFASFSSESRLRCSFGWLKNFQDSSECLRQRLASLQPKGYTRMGAALRHATSQLLAVPARRRALLVITDAKPTDYDHYEGEHGNQDIRKAVQEALNSDIRFHAVVLSDGVDANFSKLFGIGKYQVAQSAYDISNACFVQFIQALR